MTPIYEFTGAYRFLSNFYPCVFAWRTLVWGSSEAAYQAAKSLDYEVWRRLSLPDMTPGKAKRIGQRIPIRVDWEEIKYGVMLEIVTEKFRQNQLLLKALLDTRGMELQEGNTWGDRVWGVCPAGSGKGSNNLGKILMRVRDGSF